MRGAKSLASLRIWKPSLLDNAISTKISRAGSILTRGSYMNAHVLINLLNDLGNRDKMRGLPSILSLFRNEFNKFKNMSRNVRFYLSYDIKITLKSHF